MTVGGTTKLNPCSLPAEGGTIISLVYKGMHFHPPCIITLYMPPVFQRCVFPYLQRAALWLSSFHILVGATLLTSIVANVAVLR